MSDDIAKARELLATADFVEASADAGVGIMVGELRALFDRISELETERDEANRRATKTRLKWRDEGRAEERARYEPHVVKLEAVLAAARRYNARSHHVDKCPIRYAQTRPAVCECGKHELTLAIDAIDAVAKEGTGG